MNEIQELKDRREQTILEKETLERELAPYAEALDDYEVMQRLEDSLNRPGFSRHSPGSLRNAFQTLPVTADC